MHPDANWNPQPPRSLAIGDHDVPLSSDHLSGKHVALLVTGGIAAMKSPMIARALRRHGAQVTAVASSEGLRYVTEDTLAWSTNRPVVTQLSPRAEHLSGSEPFDAYLVAPATYNQQAAPWHRRRRRHQRAVLRARAHGARPMRRARRADHARHDAHGDPVHPLTLAPPSPWHSPLHFAPRATRLAHNEGDQHRISTPGSNAPPTRS